MHPLTLIWSIFLYHYASPSIALKLSEDDLLGHTLLLMNSQADIWGSACEWTWITFGVAGMAQKKKSPAGTESTCTWVQFLVQMSPNWAIEWSGRVHGSPGQKIDDQYRFFQSEQDNRRRTLEKVMVITHSNWTHLNWLDLSVERFIATLTVWWLFGGKCCYICAMEERIESTDVHSLKDREEDPGEWGRTQNQTSIVKS